MKKSSLITLLCLVLLLCASTLVLTACGECKHVGGTATCTSKAICTKCNQPYGELSSHTGGTATCLRQAVCQVCNQPYGPYNNTNHPGTLVWEKTTYTHKQYYNCCNAVVVAEANHIWQNGLCSMCNAPQSQGIGYEVSQDGTYASVTYYEGTDTDIVIASTYQGVPVTIIGGSAFSNSTHLISVVIPDSVTSIGSFAFSGCSSLTSIIIPDSVTSIGSYAFYSCTRLTSITLPFVGASATASDGYNQVFGYIFGYTTRTSSSSVSGATYQYASGSTYYYYYIPTSLTTVVVTGGTSIGSSAFRNCRTLTSVELPNSITTIESYAFDYCTSLTSLVIPNSVTSIGKAAFYYCSSLTSLVIPNSVNSIGKGVSTYCNSLTIYCEATSKPSGWDSSWNHWNRPVVWGYKP